MPISRPTPEECSPYHWTYIELVPDGDLIALLEEQMEETLRLLGDLDEERSEYRYAPGKWSVKELLGHLIDCERIMAYRCLSVARGETAQLPGFDEDAYVAAAGFGGRRLAGLLDEYRDLRRSTLSMLRGIDADAYLCRGNANGFTVSARALAYIMAGHERHHVQVLREKYMEEIEN